jgi:cobalamin biosynthesis Mg chelatase CobN
MIKENQALKSALGDVAYQKTIQTLDTIVKSIEWKSDDNQSANIANQYAEMVEKADVPKRLKDVMMKLFDGKFQTL